MPNYNSASLGGEERVPEVHGHLAGQEFCDLVPFAAARVISVKSFVELGEIGQHALGDPADEQGTQTSPAEPEPIDNA